MEQEALDRRQMLEFCLRSKYNFIVILTRFFSKSTLRAPCAAAEEACGTAILLLETRSKIQLSENARMESVIVRTFEFLVIKTLYRSAA